MLREGRSFIAGPSHARGNGAFCSAPSPVRPEINRINGRIAAARCASRGRTACVSVWMNWGFFPVLVGVRARVRARGRSHPLSSTPYCSCYVYSHMYPPHPACFLRAALARAQSTPARPPVLRAVFGLGAPAPHTDDGRACTLSRLAAARSGAARCSGHILLQEGARARARAHLNATLSAVRSVVENQPAAVLAVSLAANRNTLEWGRGTPCLLPGCPAQQAVEAAYARRATNACAAERAARAPPVHFNCQVVCAAVDAPSRTNHPAARTCRGK